VHFKGEAGRIRQMLPIINNTHPPSSPDLNVIENCWGWIKAKLRSMDRHVTSQDGLWQEVQRLWAELPQEMIDGWINNMEDRVKAVEEADGFQTGW
jgi:transposase